MTTVNESCLSAEGIHPRDRLTMLSPQSAIVYPLIIALGHVSHDCCPLSDFAATLLRDVCILD